jgi:hypothetical protein
MSSSPFPVTYPFPVSYLAMTLFGLSAMLDSGQHDDITVEDVKRHSRGGDLLKFLRDRNGGSFAMGIAEGNEFGRWYAKQIADKCEATDGRERRKYGIENRGLCLLISYTAEIVQNGDAIARSLMGTRESK